VNRTARPFAVGGIDCVCYLARDLARARSFYEGVLGMLPTMQSERWIEYTLADGATFGLTQLPEGAWHAGGGAMFAVPDIGEAVARVRAAGAPVYVEYMESPVCEIAWAGDLEGNGFALHKRKDDV